MNAEQTDLLIQYALAAAAEEEFPNNSLRAVHLLKYVYLADLAHAARHGQTITGCAWKFFHFGPWCQEVQDRIEPALAAIGAERQEFETAHDTLGVSFRIRNQDVLERLDPRLPLAASRPMRKAIKQFGCDTRGLLAFVYRTGPMLRAAPGDELDLRRPSAAEVASEEAAETLSARQAKKKAERLRSLREKVQARLASPPSQTRVRLDPAPYSSEVIDALATLWQAEAEPEAVTASVRIADEVWRSEARSEDDVP